MKQINTRILPLLLAVLLVFSLYTPATTVEAASVTGYDSADDVVYKISGGKVANWGAREEDCVFLTTYALDFYTGSNTYEVFATLDGSSNRSQVPDSALYEALQSFMSSKHKKTTTYDSLRYNTYNYTDCVMNNTNSISCFYSGKAIGPDWDSGKTWNREHTWPQSKGSNKNTPAGSDVMAVRPTATSANGDRNNDAYGESASCYDPNTGTSYNLRGDCARIMLYTYVRWGTANHLKNAWGSSGVMESVDILLKWMEEDPVDTWEMGRNDAVQSITGTRNVFVDYPELAFLLFEQEIPSDMTTPSGEAGSSTPTPSCKHTSTEIRNASQGSCTENGYTGDTYCKDCGEKVKSGSTITAPGHKDANDDSKCDTCGSTIGCAHSETELKNAREASCKEEGYTGDTVCKKCGDVVKKGESIPKTAHGEVIVDAKEATCCEDGYTGDIICPDCGIPHADGQVIPATGKHTFGEWTVVKNPTASEPGLKEHVCTVGGFRETQELPADPNAQAPTEPATPAETTPDSQTPDQEPADMTIWIIVGVAAVVVIGVVVVIIVVKKKK